MYNQDVAEVLQVSHEGGCGGISPKEEWCAIVCVCVCAWGGGYTFGKSVHHCKMSGNDQTHCLYTQLQYTSVHIAYKYICYSSLPEQCHRRVQW